MSLEDLTYEKNYTNNRSLVRRISKYLLPIAAAFYLNDCNKEPSYTQQKVQESAIVNTEPRTPATYKARGCKFVSKEIEINIKGEKSKGLACGWECPDASD